MKIAFVSGKGGTGKSTVTASIAHELSRQNKLVLVDADSDCPNQHIVFGGLTKTKKPISVSKLASVDLKKCIGCGKCVSVCTFNAVAVSRGKAQVSRIGCEGCGACVIACPKKAVSLIPVKSGSLVVSETKTFPLVYGHLLPGASGTGKMVFEARKLAEELAGKKGIELTLIDAPPGIGCPVIASVMNCDYVIGVVEPTPASLRNLKRVLDVVRHFKIPYSVVVNKCGLSSKQETVITRRFGKKIIAHVPYDEEIPRLLARGIPPILGKGNGAKGLMKLAGKLKKQIMRA